MSRDLLVALSVVGLIAFSAFCGPIGSDGTFTGSGGTTTADGGSDSPRPSDGSGGSPESGGSYSGPPTGENTTTSCVVPALATYGKLTTDAYLPDPFMSLDGTRITGTDQWTCRRAEIMAQAQQYELGTKPPRPSMVSGAYANNAITVNVSEAGKAKWVNWTVPMLQGVAAMEADAEAPDGTADAFGHDAGATDAVADAPPPDAGATDGTAE
jgi:hypothetical protein